MIAFTLAVPNKGRLKEPALELLNKIGLFANESRNLSYRINGSNIELAFLAAKDIPKFIECGAVDIGVTGYDVWQESNSQLKELLDLKFGSCDLVVAGLTGIKIPEIKSKVRVATSFPSLAAKYFSQKGISAEFVNVSGAEEALPKFEIADLVVVLRNTGRTLMENNLVVYDKILDSSARLLCAEKNLAILNFAKKMEAVL